MKTYNGEVINKLNITAVGIRKHVIEMLYRAKSGHPGGSLSAVDAIVALYFHHMNHNPKKPEEPDRDRFILSKGHAAPALYAVLAECGYFDVKELKRLREINSILQGHPVNFHIPGVEASTGSLGHGLSFANGVALAGKADKKNYHVYVMVGDGETDEGQVCTINLIISLLFLTEIFCRSMGTQKRFYVLSPYMIDGVLLDGMSLK